MWRRDALGIDFASRAKGLARLSLGHTGLHLGWLTGVWAQHRRRLPQKSPTGSEVPHTVPESPRDKVRSYQPAIGR